LVKILDTEMIFSFWFTNCIFNIVKE
jgi:hypothetical protein